jgi:AcrR family transcriptional regulator
LVAATSRQGLRERKKQRTRHTIVDTATRLFVEQGYQQTTLVQIAEEADVAPSTFFNYFPTKVDIVFCLFDSVIDSAQRRIAERPDDEPAIEAVAAWLTEELPSVENSDDHRLGPGARRGRTAPTRAARRRPRRRVRS